MRGDSRVEGMVTKGGQEENEPFLSGGFLEGNVISLFY
jgi:hypothetical protein